MALRETTPEDVAAFIDLRIRGLLRIKREVAKAQPLNRYEKTVKDQTLICIRSKINLLLEIRDKVLTIDALNPK